MSGHVDGVGQTSRSSASCANIFAEDGSRSQVKPMKRVSRVCTGPMQRREFLAAGMLGVGGGLTLPDLFRLQAKAEETGRGAAPETSVIFVWLPGGPPQDRKSHV